MNTRIAGLVGAGLLALGVFLPILNLPIVGAVSLLGTGTNPVAYALIVLAGLSAWLTFKDRPSDLFWPAVAAVATVAYSFIRILLVLAELKAELAKQLKDNPFAGIAQAATQTLQPQWGWAILAAGAGTLLFVAVQSRRGAGEPLFALGQPRWLAAVSLVAALVAPAADLWSAVTKPASEPASALSIGPSASEDDGESKAEKAEKAAYIRDHIKLYELKAEYVTPYSDKTEKVPSVDYKLKNAGPRTLKQVTVTVVFYDAAGKPIAEDEFYPASSLVETTQLKPNYIYQIPEGLMYTADNIPSEWAEGKVTASVTDIEFADAE